MSKDILPVQSSFLKQQVVKILWWYSYKCTYCWEIQTRVQIDAIPVQQIPENAVRSQ